MEEGFLLPVTHKGRELEFEATLITSGYTHKFLVNIDGFEVFFEPDEERNYRAFTSDKAIQQNHTPDLELIGLVGCRIEQLFSKK